MGMEIPPAGTRGAGSLGTILNRLFAPVMAMQIARYRRSRGAGQPHVMGFPALLLSTVGARTGRRRTVLLGGFPDGPAAWLVVASKGGAATHPAWFLNMARHPEGIWIEVGARRLRAAAELLRGAPREQALQRIAAIAPRYAGYQRRTDREIPIVRLTPAEGGVEGSRWLERPASR
jgi:deazaflavin-dependent oxidoreductase (nitroreductase family)